MIQLYLEFTWSDLTPEEAIKFLDKSWVVKSSRAVYAVIDKSYPKLIAAGTFDFCLKYIKEAQEFYTAHRYYTKDVYDMKFLQLVGV